MDSAVAAALVHRAIGDRLTNVFVDTGMLRLNEYQETLDLLRNRVGLNVDGVDASKRFLTRLAGVTDPETKRKTIGADFIAVFAEEARKLSEKSANGAGKIRFLVQGTSLPRRHRIRFRQRPIRHNQNAPQRRRPARGHALRAHRASSRSFQGRSPPHRPRTRPYRKKFS